MLTSPPISTLAPDQMPLSPLRLTPVSVEDSMVARGQRGTAFGCPLALALTKAAPVARKQRLGVRAGWVWMTEEGATAATPLWELPEGVYDAVCRYDAGGPWELRGEVGVV